MIRRALAALVIVGLAIGLLIITWPQLFDLQRTQGVAQIVAFRTLAGVSALVVACVLLVAAVAMRRIRRFSVSLAVLLLVFVAATGMVLASRGFGTEARRPAPEDGNAAGTVTVMAWNTEGDSPSPDEVADLTLEEGADVVSLPETSEVTASAVAARMTAAGHPMQVIHVSTGEGSDRSTALLIEARLGEYVLDDSRGDTTRLPTIVARPAGGTGPVLVAAHPIAPLPGYLDSWNEDLRFLAGLCDTGSVIMAGDFNSTVDHYAGLSATKDYGLGRCIDAAVVAGTGAAGSWPTALPALLATPIDHVMATADWVIADAQVVTDVDGLGSDHRPVLATLNRVDAPASLG